MWHPPRPRRLTYDARLTYYYTFYSPSFARSNAPRNRPMWCEYARAGRSPIFYHRDRLVDKTDFGRACGNKTKIEPPTRELTSARRAHNNRKHTFSVCEIIFRYVFAFYGYTFLQSLILSWHIQMTRVFKNVYWIHTRSILDKTAIIYHSIL